MKAETAWSWTLRGAGLAGLAHQTLVENFDRPYLLALFALMMVGSDAVEAWARRSK